MLLLYHTPLHLHWCVQHISLRIVSYIVQHVVLRHGTWNVLNKHTNKNVCYLHCLSKFSSVISCGWQRPVCVSIRIAVFMVLQWHKTLCHCHVLYSCISIIPTTIMQWQHLHGKWKAAHCHQNCQYWYLWHFIQITVRHTTSWIVNRVFPGIC